MGAIFNIENPLWNFMGKVADLVILNVLALVCSIPIVTIGASWTALYYVAIRIVRKEEGYVIRDFFHSFKENFKQATIIWLLAVAIVAIFIGDVVIYRMMPEQIPQALMIVVLILAYLAFGTIVYVFPVLARFHNTTKNTIKNAFILSIINIPFTLILMILMIVPFVLGVYVIELTPLILMMGISLPAFFSSMIFVRIFRKIEPAEDAMQEGDIEIETL